MLQFRILGPVEACADGRPLSLGGPRQVTLLALLLLHANRVVASETIVDAVWSDEGRDAARVRVIVARLRRALGPSADLRAQGGGYTLTVAPEQLDAARFEAHVADGERQLRSGDPRAAAASLSRALGLWREAPLGALADRDFAHGHVERLDELRLHAVELRLEAELGLGHHQAIIADALRLAGQHPFRERLQAHAMVALYRSGRQTDALEVYRNAHAQMAELGLAPGPQLRELQSAVLRQDPALASPGARRPRLPRRNARLFGRERDLASVSALLDSSRLVTLTGAGGVGKTALALELARRLEARFADGVHLVELAAVRAHADVAAAIADALAAEPQAGESTREALLRTLARQRCLLVLDNFEHVLEAAPLIADLLDANPELDVVCSSRAPLRIRAEQQYLVEPLPVPATNDLGDTPAEAMFIDRARARDPRFAATAEVATICRRLGGLPLAVELAAARTTLLSTPELAARLDRALPLLVGGSRDAPERQRTLRATLEWSERLLTAEQRRAFARLSVFAGGATLAAAEEVAAADLATLEALTDIHLVDRADGRLTMLEPVREYAAERLTGDELSSARERHAAWCERHVRDRLPSLGGRVSAAALAGVQDEADNLRAALTIAIAAQDGARALALACAYGPWWWRTGRGAEGTAALTSALALAADRAPTERLAEALLLRGRLAGPAQSEQRVADLRRSVELWRVAGDAEPLVTALKLLGQFERFRGRREQAAKLADEALAVADASGDAGLRARALAARVIADPDHPEALARARAVAPLLADGGEPLDALHVLVRIGYRALVDDRLEVAVDLFRRALPLLDAVQSPRAAFNLRTNLGIAQLFSGDEPAATTSLSLALDALAGLSFDHFGELLLACAAVAARAGELDASAQLDGASRSRQLPARSHDEQLVLDRLDHEFLTPARRASNSRAWGEHAAAAEQFTRDQAIELARRTLASTEHPTSASGG